MATNSPRISVKFFGGKKFRGVYITRLVARVDDKTVVEESLSAQLSQQIRSNLARWSQAFLLLPYFILRFLCRHIPIDFFCMLSNRAYRLFFFPNLKLTLSFLLAR